MAAATGPPSPGGSGLGLGLGLEAMAILISTYASCTDVGRTIYDSEPSMVGQATEYRYISTLLTPQILRGRHGIHV